MNQTFSLNRFTQLNRWFWAANGRTYSLAMLGIALATTFLLARVLTFTGYDAGMANNNVIYFNMASLAAIVLFSSHIVSVLYDQHSAIPYLMLPASRTEKFTVIVLYFVVFIVGYGLFYVAVETLIFQLANSRLPATGNSYQSELLTVPDGRKSSLASTCLILLITAVIGLLGSLYFRQGVLIRNIVLIISLFVGMTIAYGYLMGAFFPGLETHTSRLFGDLYVYPKNQFPGSQLPLLTFIRYVFPWLVLIGLWITARIRFNEIER